MVISVSQWDVHPDQVQAYAAWVQTAVPRLLAVPGLLEFRADRPITGTAQVVTTYTFPDMAAWSAWHSHAAIQQLVAERCRFTHNDATAVWGSPLLACTPVPPCRPALSTPAPPTPVRR